MSKYKKALMKTAEVWAEESYCVKRKVGAVVEIGGRIISTGFNGTEPGMPNVCEDDSGKTNHHLVIHAEENAIRQCRDLDLTGATMWATTLPCKECSELIIERGFTTVIYKDTYKDLKGLELLRDNGVIVTQYGDI